MKEDILHNLKVIQERINKVCDKIGRNPNEVKLLLATKTVSADRIKMAIEAGYPLIAENKVQEVTEKYEDLKNIPHTSHFIGHLQTNKIKFLLQCGVSCIQSIDKLSTAKKIQNRLEFENKTIEILVQVNTSAEISKFGCEPDQTLQLVKDISLLNRIKIKGLMTIGLFAAEQEKVRPCFQLLKKLQQEIVAENIPNVEMRELSMGMSGDFETAIEEGATIVRIGTSIFGKRIYPDSYYWNEG